MTFIRIHESGRGCKKITVDSWYNGGAYNVSFGEAGSPMRNIYFQGDDAIAIRDEFDALETAEPETLSRDLWLRVLDPYL
jgi:hypothetical protein